MSIKIALAGNPNSGKTTLFNALTGSNQFVGNWPGVTVEKKEGKLKGYKDVVIIDLPGTYSLSPYTLEEVVARNYLIDERPDAILNIVDGTNLERNLYLTTQLTEIGIPVVVAINMMDVVNKNGDKINFEQLSKKLGCEVVEISALKSTGIMEAAEKAVNAVNSTKTVPMHNFSGVVEHALAHIEEAAVHNMPQEQQRWYAIKIFERDKKVLEKLSLSADILSHIEQDVKEAEDVMDDDAESIITNERYIYITSIIKGCYKKKNTGRLSASDKIDRVVTNRWLALPIFAIVMLFVYYISVTTVGTWATDWANDGVFGNGWRLFGIGTPAYEESVEKYETQQSKIEAFIAASQQQGINVSALQDTVKSHEPDTSVIDTFITEASGVSTIMEIKNENGEIEKTLTVAISDFQTAIQSQEPNPADFGIWIPGVPVLMEKMLEAIGTAKWLNGLIIDGIVGGVGSVLGFVPQMLVLFLFLAFLEACGYMARIAFIMDRIFRKFGLSGKSFIPMLIGSGCGVPGIMASRTIENDRDRKMTIITTTFVPCGAKLPIIALIAGALFGGAWWVAPSAYFVGILSIVVSGVILKKTRMFTGEPAPFVIELPSYHMPTTINLLRSMWERGWSFVKKAGTIILLSTIFVWVTSNFGIVNGRFAMVENLSDGFLANIGSAIAFIFTPLGWGNWQATVATITGLVAKENVVGTFGVLYGFAEVVENGSEVWGTLATSFTTASAYSFLIFNLLCAPCFAAIGAIKREMNSAKWTWFAIGYQTLFAYVVSLCVYQLWTLFTGGGFSFGTIVAILLVIAFVYLLLRPESGIKKLQSKEIKSVI